MSADDDLFASAMIRFDGVLRPDATGIDEALDLFVVETTDPPFWFEMLREFAQDGINYSVRVTNFGRLSKLMGGKRTFSRQQAKDAKSLVERFFLGSTEHGIVPYKDAMMSTGKCLGVTFAWRWITVA